MSLAMGSIPKSDSSSLSLVPASIFAPMETMDISQAGSQNAATQTPRRTMAVINGEVIHLLQI